MKLVRKQWFLISLLILMILGFFAASPFERLSNVEWLKWGTVCITMFLMAWPLEFGRLTRTVSRPVAPLIGCVMNMAVIPLLMWPLAALAGLELAPGMIVAAAAPSTLASAAVLTRRAGGDDSVSIMVTLLTNASCFLVMPFWIMVQTGNEVDSGKLVGTIYKLFFFVVLPIGAAQLARLNSSSAQWATRKKPVLSLLALIGVLGMVFLGAVKMGLRFQSSSDTQLSFQALGIAALILIGVHCVVFWLGLTTARVCGVSRESQIAVGFSGSQKTLMIGLTTAVNLGMNIIPIILYHSLQLVVDAVFAEKLRETPDSD